MKPPTVSAWIALLVFVLTLLDHFLGVAAVGYVPGGLLVLFLLIEAVRMPRSGIVAAGALAAGGLAAGSAGGDLAAVVATAIHRTQPFFLLFASTAWLHVPAEISPSLRVAQQLALNQPMGRRFPVLLAVSHGLGAVLNLVGISLLVGIIHNAPSENLRLRFTRAITQGFLAAACWTPFFVAMSVGLSLVPGLAWSDVAPFGLAAALLLTALSWTMDRLLYRRPEAAEDRPAMDGSSRFHWRMAVVPVTLFAAVIGLVETARMPIPVALGLVAPAYAVSWMMVLTAGRASPALVATDLVRRVVGSLPSLRGEILLFLSANLFGTGIATVLPPALVGRLLEGLALPPDALIVLALAAILVSSAVGVHPLVPVLVIGSVVPPQALGLPPAVFCAAMVAMWGLGAVVSPLSGTNLFLRRVGGLSAWRLAWIWNGPYGVAGAVVIGIAIIVTRHLGIA